MGGTFSKNYMLTQHAQVATLTPDGMARHDEAYARLIGDSFRQALSKHNFPAWSVHRNGREVCLWFTHDGTDLQRDEIALANEECVKTFLKATLDVYEVSYEVMKKRAGVEAVPSEVGLGNMCAKRAAAAPAQPLKKGKHSTEAQKTMLLEYFQRGTMNGVNLMTQKGERSAYPQKEDDRPAQIGKLVGMETGQVVNWFVTQRQRFCSMAKRHPDPGSRQYYAEECERLGLRGGRQESQDSPQEQLW